MSNTTSDLYLSPKQQDLLVAALTSNQSPSEERSSNKFKSTQRNSMPFTPGGLSDPSAPGSGQLDFSDDSPYLDFGVDGEGDDSFNFEDGDRMFGDLPGGDSPDDDSEVHTHLHDKRKSIDGKDDDDEGGGKRREGEDKTAKKPGRKPLTSEPTSKRKAQNRAAQRAFRERKEKHLKDLETKVEDLEKASEATNHENGMLKAQVERLQVELKEYRKRLSWISSNGPGRQQTSNSQQRSSSITGSANNDFQFQFPKFGDLPVTGIFGGSNSQTSQQSQARTNQRTASVPAQTSASPVSVPTGRHSVSSVASIGQQSKSNSMHNSPRNNNYSASPTSYSGQDQANNLDSLTGLFSPSILEATKHSPQGYFQANTTPQGNIGGRGSFDNGFSATSGIYSNSSLSNTESPGSSTESHQHSTSSIGTSPDPTFNSPYNKLQDLGLNTINEETQISNNPTDVWNGTSNFASDIDPSGFNWLAQQNGGSFDPVLFGDYRETQDNVLSQDFGSFFNDAYPLPELGSPGHNYGELPAASADTAPKTDLMSRVEAAKDGEGTKPDAPKMMTCNKIWDRLQSMEKFRNGEIDIDNLCSELRAKAKCSEGGAVVDEKHVNKILGL